MEQPIFSPAFGNRPSYLVGREDVLSEMLSGLATEPGNRRRSTVLLGQRGSGKTVLLLELAERASKQGVVVATPTIATEGMLERVVEKIQDAGQRYVGEPRSTRVSGGSIGAFGFSAGLEFSRDVQETKSAAFRLTQLARTLTARGHGILILIDELQANSPDVRSLVAVYQELIGERLDVSLVLAGLPGAVSATLNDRVLTFLNRADRVRLEPLRDSEVIAFLDRAFSTLNIVISKDQLDCLAREIKGSPYLLQLVGYNISQRLPHGGIATDDLLAVCCSVARDDFERDVCMTTLLALSERDVDFLVAMSRDDGRSKMSDIAERLDVKADYAQKYRKRLIDAGVIEPAGRGFVRFDVPYLQDYLKREYADM